MFYVIEPEGGKRFGTNWAYGESSQLENIGESQKCPVCGGAVGMRRWLPPHRVKLSSANPKKWGDFVWGAGFLLMVSSKFKDIYEREQLSGIEEFSNPVEIVRVGKLKSGQFSTSPPLYHLIHVPWGGANQNDTASGLTHEKPKAIVCNYCRVGVSWRKQEGVIIEEGSWNGKDIFKPRNAPVPYMVSERFKHVAEDYQLSNIWMIPTDRFCYDERRWGLWYVKG